MYAFQELKLSKAVAIQGFTLFEAGALVGTLLWGWLSDLANGRRGLVACIALALIIATLGVYQHASNEYIYLASRWDAGIWPYRLGRHLRRAGYRRDWLYLPDGDSGGDGRTQNPPREKNSAVDSGINVTGDFCPA